MPARRTLNRILGLQALLLAGAAAPAPGGKPLAPTPAPNHPAIEQPALARLQATSTRLANAKAISFRAVTTYEHPARNGQPLWYSTMSFVTMRRPNKLQVITPGDGPPSEFYYDGKVMAAYAPDADLIAVANAPPTLDATLEEANKRAALYFPFSEVLVSDPYKNLTEGLTYAYYVGQSAIVGGVVTDIIALTNERVQAEVWIGVKDGLPREIRAVFPGDPVKQSYEIDFSDWRLDRDAKPGAFTTPHIKTSPRMQFDRPDTPPPAAPAPAPAPAPVAVPAPTAAPAPKP